MTHLLEKLAAFEPFRVLLIGDFMLDQHVYGAAERLSPDAPVPVLQATRFEDLPGGASNVARCLAALGGEVACFGVVGDDAEGRALRSTLAGERCDVEGLLTDPSRPTTVKRSLIGLAQHRHPQKMFRVDLESRLPVPGPIAERLLEAVEAALPSADVVCLEDYDKGVATPTICRRLQAMCAAAGVPLLVDPASLDDYSKYRGVTAITPNRTEAERATGLDTPLDADAPHNARLAEVLSEALNIDAVILTLDRHGALLLERGGDPERVPTVARAVYDVTGAGDMVLAALAGAVANGLGWPDAVRFANAAAGLEVEVFGVQPIPLDRIRHAILHLEGGLSGKIRSLEELLVELAVHRSGGHRIVLTNGCFDVLHVGHLRYLAEARSLGDVLVVGVNADEQVTLQKGDGRPVFRLEERLEILSELRAIDYLVPFTEPTAERLIRAIEPDLYVKGGDYAPEEINEHGLLEDLGIEVRVLAHAAGLGSTDVIQRFVRAYRG